MGKKVTILILAVFAGAGSATGSFDPEKTSQALLSDGFVLTGVDGKLSSPDGNDVWLFVLASDVNDGKVRVGADTALQLLPSSTLERMTADMKARGGEDYRIWVRATKYKGRNFLFPFYFLPLSKVKDSRLAAPTDANSADGSQAAQLKPTPAANDANGTLVIPKEITDRLSDRPTVYRQQPQEPNNQSEKLHGIKQDYVLANRTGLISLCVPSTPLGTVMRDAYCEKGETLDAIRTAQYEFVLDGLGLTFQQTSFRLLPCQVLEQAEQQSVRSRAQMDAIRFKVAGIVTEYKGDKYLLLQTITKAYSHGNFGR